MIFESQMLRKFSNAHFSSFVFNYAIGAFIAILFRLSGPSAIFLTVTQVIIDPVKAMTTGWTTPHVIDEVFKNKPVLRNGDISLGVFPCFKGLVTSHASTHVVPTTVCARLFPFPITGASFAMADFGCRDNYPHTFLTPATFPCSQGVSKNRNLGPTATTTQPPCISSLSVLLGSSEDCPASEYLSYNVFDEWVKRGTIILVIAHDKDGLISSEGHSALTGGLCAFNISQSGGLSIWG